MRTPIYSPAICAALPGVLPEPAWTHREVGHYTTYTHNSGQYTVVVTSGGSDEGTVRLTRHFGGRDRIVQRWERPDPKNLWALLHHAGAPDIAVPQHPMPRRTGAS